MGFRNYRNSELFKGMIRCSRFYSWDSKVDPKKLRPMILKRIENRATDYQVRTMVPVAQDVLNARNLLIQGVSTLLQVFPLWACRFCPDVYIGEEGHLIKTCHGFKRRAKKHDHEWIRGSLNDVLVPVETFHLDKVLRGVIKHHQRFDRVSAVVELCRQLGAEPYDESQCSSSWNSKSVIGAESLSSDDLRLIARGTMGAWETVRSGVKKLLLVYPAKVCKHCSEVHVGALGHRARLCGVLKNDSWHGAHIWKKAEVDDLVPPKVVWHRRPRDPPALLDEGRDFYGHAPAVVDLCSKAGAIVPSKYFCMMKVHGLSGPI